MYPATMQTISAAQGREMRDQAAAWRRAQEARSADRARSARFPFAHIVRNARSLTGKKRLQGSAAA